MVVTKTATTFWAGFYSILGSTSWVLTFRHDNLLLSWLLKKPKMIARLWTRQSLTLKLQYFLSLKFLSLSYGFPYPERNDGGKCRVNSFTTQFPQPYQLDRFSPTEKTSYLNPDKSKCNKYFFCSHKSLQAKCKIDIWQERSWEETNLGSIRFVGRIIPRNTRRINCYRLFCDVCWTRVSFCLRDNCLISSSRFKASDLVGNCSR